MMGVSIETVEVARLYLVGPLTLVAAAIEGLAAAAAVAAPSPPPPPSPPLSPPVLTPIHGYIPFPR
jgi:hypothetical protein